MHDEYDLLRAARKMIGGPPYPRYPPVAHLLSPLLQGRHPSMASYITYRDAFPWRTSLDRSFWREYLPAVRAAAEKSWTAVVGSLSGAALPFIARRRS